MLPRIAQIYTDKCIVLKSVKFGQSVANLFAAPRESLGQAKSPTFVFTQTTICISIKKNCLPQSLYIFTNRFFYQG
jgi:hypothetical protein